MRTSKVKNIALLSAVIVFAICAYAQAISFTVGSGNYYVSVGDHDYLPYSYNAYPGYQQQQPGLSFQSAMSDYGTWVSMQPFGNVWRPYAAAGWRPYTQGHWVYTQYGPTWEGYEPWAWAGYHYGNWVSSPQYGWVWIPGYDYHSGRVAWAQGYNSIGWMPLPPTGYDYSRGYLSYMGPTNQFSYNDNDFSVGFGIGTNDYYYNGGPYYDPRYRDLYYNQGYLGSGVNLWTFIDPTNFGSDNYANYYYGGDYARDQFDRRLVRISTRPLDRVVIERIVRQPIQIQQVRVTEVQVDGRPLRLVAVQGEEEKIRENANRVVREVIAPAFAEKGRQFKGKNSKGQAALDKALHQENNAQQVETLNSDDIIRESKQNEQKQEQHRAQIRQTKRDEVVRIEKEGKIREKNSPGQLKKEEDTRKKNSQVTPANPEPQENRRNPQVDQQLDKQQKDQEQNKRNKNPNIDLTPDQEQQQQQQDQQNRRNKQIDQTPTDQQDQEREKRLKDEHSNTSPEADENSNQSDEQDVKSDKDNPDKNVNANDQQKSDNNNKKKAKSKKSKKDKNNNNPDEPPQD